MKRPTRVPTKALAVPAPIADPVSAGLARIKLGRNADAARAPFNAGAPSATPFFGRGQIETAIWRYVSHQAEKPPSTLFLTRIKRLLEQDRVVAEREHPKPAPRAVVVTSSFNCAFQQFPNADGEAARYTPLDAAFVWIALNLQHRGFKRQEIVDLIWTIRDGLVEDLSRAILHGIEDSLRDAFFLGWDPIDEDNRIFLLLPQVEDASEYVDIGLETALGGDVWICRGMSDLHSHIEIMPLEFLVIVEIGAPAYVIAGLLTRAPSIRRGRPTT